MQKFHCWRNNRVKIKNTKCSNGQAVLFSLFFPLLFSVFFKAADMSRNGHSALPPEPFSFCLFPEPAFTVAPLSCRLRRFLNRWIRRWGVKADPTGQILADTVQRLSISLGLGLGIMHIFFYVASSIMGWRRLVKVTQLTLSDFLNWIFCFIFWIETEEAPMAILEGQMTESTTTPYVTGRHWKF